jgi:hypothetical protein
LVVAAIVWKVDMPDYPVPGRDALTNARISAHEIGHCIIARLLGSHVQLVEIIPHGIFSGRCIRTGFASSLALFDEKKAETPRDLIEICTKVGPPPPGASRVELAEPIMRVQVLVTELVAGSIAERVMHPDLLPLNAEHDKLEARALAATCASNVDALLIFCSAEAESLIRAYVDVVETLVGALLEKGRLFGEEIDRIIADTISKRQVAAEHARREQWRRIEQNAAMFERIRKQTGDSP